MIDSEHHTTFSKRENIDDTEKELQYKTIDDELKHSIWNALFRHYLDIGKIPSSVAIQDNAELKRFFEKILYDFFKVPADTILNGYLSNAIEEVRQLYYELKWNRIYDFIEFLACNIENDSNADDGVSFVDSCNKILVQENSGYRFANNKIIKITSN